MIAAYYKAIENIVVCASSIYIIKCKTEHDVSKKRMKKDIIKG